MELQLLLAIFLSMCALTISQDFQGSSMTKPQKRYTSVVSTIKRIRPKTILIKRVPGISPLFPSKSASRVLNKAPLNLLQNGPYYINHYIYCDSVDQHTIDQIKAGTYSSNNDIQLLNLHKDGFHGNGGFTGNKEFHVLHLPKDKNHNLNDIQLQLSLLNAHKSPEVPDVDLDLNKNLGNFEVNLEDIKPLDLDTSYLHDIKLSSNEVVTPLISGQVSSGQNHKHHDNIIQITEYLNERDHPLHPFGSHETNSQGEILDLPHFETHPLEQDYGKASYDTPGAVDSYGHPASESPFRNNHLNSYGNSIKGNGLYQSEEFINQLNEINGLQRKRRMDAYISSTESSVVSSTASSTTSSTTEKQGKEQPKSKNLIRYPNHKYDS